MQEKLQPFLDSVGSIRNWRVATKLLATTALVMVVLTVVIDLLVVRQVQGALETQTATDVTGTTNFLKYLVDQRGAPNVDTAGNLNFGIWSASDYTIVDAVKRNTRAEAAVFFITNGQVVQQATTFQNTDSSRMTGSTLTGPAAEALARGENYTGTASFLGQPYVANYLVIKDAAGKPIAAVFTGKPTAFISQQTTQITGVIALVSMLLLTGSLALLFVLMSRLVTRPLKELETAAERITAGDYDVRMPLRNDDELGQVARTVNSMIDRVTDNARTQETQNQEMQRQIVKLLDEVSSVAEGDLTVEAEVSADALGAVADSFNYMITELRQIIGRVNAATQQVGDSTDEILATTDVLNRSAQQQAARIADTSTAVEEMAVSIQQVSENAAISARVAREARATAIAGADAVAATVAGMERIRAQVQETATKIEQLGASSQEIGAIVSLIREVADQTELLALNAAIEAALAGDHGKGFAVVAEEVRRLAERTAVASAQIDTLVKGVQEETREAIAAMAEGTQEVVAGARVADEAGRALARIDATTTQLAELIEAISLAAEQQARASSGIARAMGEISGITTGTTAGTEQAAISVAALATLADDLRSSVAAFRLGAETLSAPQAPLPRHAPPARPARNDHRANGHASLPVEYSGGGDHDHLDGGMTSGAFNTAIANQRKASRAVATVEKPSLYELLGGRESIAVIVGDFYQRILADQQLAPIFAGVDLGHLKIHQELFLSHVLGGPNQYTGRRMEQAHAGLQITPAQFGAVAGHLSDSLESLGVPQPLVAEVIDHVAKLQGSIVGK